MTPVRVAPPIRVRDLATGYRQRRVFSGITFDVTEGQCLGVVGANGSGKTTLLRTLVGCLTPWEGLVQIRGRPPREALRDVGVAYFAGEASLPGFVRASHWGRLGAGDTITADRRRLRWLSRGTRQLVGLRTVLGRHPLGVIVLDEPWEGLDADASRWLSATLELKRDRGAAVVLSSHRAHDLAGLCDAYLFLVDARVMLCHAVDMASDGIVTAGLLTDVLDRLRVSRS